MKHFKISLLLIAIIFLVGCTHIVHEPTFKYISWKERRAAILQQNKNWIINGSISITYNKKRDIARFWWQQNHDSYKITLSGPMNLGRVKVTGNINRVGLCGSGGECTYANSSEQLLFNQFGWKLPISNMKYWILSLPAAKTKTKTESEKFDQYGHLIRLEQQDWKINYSEFKTIKNIDLPTMIELKNSKLFIKIKIKNISLLLNQ